MNGPFIIHWFPLITHDTAQLDLPCHQFVFLTHLKLKPWRWSRLCWCPACKEAVVSGKWFAHWQCILCWQSPAVFTVWWINPVDRLTCSHCDTLRVRKMQRTAEKRFVRHVCLKNPCPLWNLSTHSLTETWLPENRSTFRQLCITLWLHHAHPFIAAAGKRLSHRDKQSVWSRSCFVQDSWQCSDCALSCAIWLLQTNEQLSRLSFYQQWVGSGAASLLAADVCKMWHPAPCQKQVPESGSTLHLLCIMVASCPSLRCSCMKNLSHRDKQRVWSKSYGFKICYNPVIVLSVVLWDCCKPTNTCRDWAFSNSGLEVGLPASSLPMLAKCDTLPGDCFDMLVFRNPSPQFLLGIPSIHSLPEASGSWERQYTPPALQWLHPAHPFVAATEKNVPHAEKQSVCSRSCGSQDLLQCSDCALSCAVRLLQTNEHLSRLSF